VPDVGQANSDDLLRRARLAEVNVEMEEEVVTSVALVNDLEGKPGRPGPGIGAVDDSR
jgi:hypothetical protein